MIPNLGGLINILVLPRLFSNMYGHGAPGHPHTDQTAPGPWWVWWFWSIRRRCRKPAIISKRELVRICNYCTYTYTDLNQHEDFWIIEHHLKIWETIQEILLPVMPSAEYLLKTGIVCPLQDPRQIAIWIYGSRPGATFEASRLQSSTRDAWVCYT